MISLNSQEVNPYDRRPQNGAIDRSMISLTSEESKPFAGHPKRLNTWIGFDLLMHSSIIKLRFERHKTLHTSDIYT